MYFLRPTGDEVMNFQDAEMPAGAVRPGEDSYDAQRHHAEGPKDQNEPAPISTTYLKRSMSKNP